MVSSLRSLLIQFKKKNNLLLIYKDKHMSWQTFWFNRLFIWRCLRLSDFQNFIKCYLNSMSINFKWYDQKIALLLHQLGKPMWKIDAHLLNRFVFKIWIFFSELPKVWFRYRNVIEMFICCKSIVHNMLHFSEYWDFSTTQT